MISASQVRELISEYLSHEDAEKLVREFAALSYNIHKNGDPEAIALVRAIEFKMADFRSGCIVLPVFQANLRKLVTPEVSIQASTTTSFVTPGLEWPADSQSLRQFVDTRFAWV